MNENENNIGVLTKDFIKKHLQKETELENKIFDLTEQIKSLKSNYIEKNNSIYEVDPYELLKKLIRYASITNNSIDSDISSLTYTNNAYHINQQYNNFMLSIYDCPLTAIESQYLMRLLYHEIPELINENNIDLTSNIKSVYNSNVQIYADGCSYG